MLNEELRGLMEATRQRLCADAELGPYVDQSLRIPDIYERSGPVRLIILGQDPTVKNPEARKKIKTVLNLCVSGGLKTYLMKVCALLDIILDQEVYATNLYKNFFIDPPTQITKPNFLFDCREYWLPVLRWELAHFPGVPVLSLGEPLLETIVCDSAKGKIRDYWGYMPGWKKGETRDFSYLKAEENILGRVVLPFPHQPSWQRKKFYSDRLAAYCAFVKPLVP